MDGYAVSNQTFGGVYMIQGGEPGTQVTTRFPQIMYGEVTPGYFVEQSSYSLGSPVYGCVSTVVDCVDDQECSGLDGDDDIHYSGVIHENLPYLCYAPSYGYIESPYNPYSPYIPGAVVDGDGSTAATHPYIALPSYADCVLLPAQMPEVIHSGAEVTSNGTGTSFMNNTRSAECNSSKVGKSANSRSGKHHPLQTVSDSFKHLASAKVSLVQRPQGHRNGKHNKGSSDGNQIKSGLASCKDSSLSTHVQDGANPKLFKDVGECPPHTWNGLNRTSGPRKPENELVLKAYTTRAGNPDAQGNIRIFRDHYNHDDFPVDYVNVKFFVIKSYSEDDVHKGVKYNVWSSTSGGNRKLNAAFKDAQRLDPEDTRRCPIFLFFSVNASGQFCGVAEMIGPVDFETDMDFWQQDKWIGSFPVKWHFIKDVSNLMLRHITLENNENKPVTNSRDTQEIPYKKGLEMLRIFKNHISKTSLLDDFMYYETRQRILLQERASKRKDNAISHANPCGSISSSSLADDSFPEKHYPEEDNAKGSFHLSVTLDVPEIDALTLNPKAAESVSELRTSSVASTNCCPRITIGSLPVPFIGLKDGTAPLDPSRNK